jgi:hypothetical protein
MLLRMRLLLVIGILAFGTYGHASLAGQSFPEPLGSPQFLASQTWKPSSDIDKIVANWSPYTGEQGFSDRTILKATRLELPGGIFEAEYRVDKNDPFVEILISAGAQDYKSDCSHFRALVTGYFGEPTKLIDRSKPGKENSWVEWDADWLFGQTRVRASCAGLMMGDNFITGIALILYRHHTMLKALEDFVYVECSVKQQQYVGSMARGNTPPQMRPFTLLIDPNRQTLLRQDKSAFSKVERYSDEEIVVTNESETGVVTLRLDRMTGGVSMQTRLKKDASSGTDGWGKCERVSGEKKF